MIRLILLAIWLIFGVIGLSEWISWLWFLLYRKPKNAQKIAVIVPDRGQLEKQVLYVREQYRWHGRKYADRILFVGENFPQSVRDLCKEYGEIRFCSPRECEEVITEEKQRVQNRSPGEPG